MASRYRTNVCVMKTDSGNNNTRGIRLGNSHCRGANPPNRSTLRSPPSQWLRRERGARLDGKASIQHALLVKSLADNLESKR